MLGERPAIRLFIGFIRGCRWPVYIFEYDTGLAYTLYSSTCSSRCNDLRLVVFHALLVVPCEFRAELVAKPERPPVMDALAFVHSSASYAGVVGRCMLSRGMPGL
jgi:hypothetical protein